MKRLSLVVLAVLLSLVTNLGFAAPNTRAASLNDFVISNYTIDYHLTRDNENRSVLVTDETIVAEFPSAGSVNHGIERYIPTSYDGHPTNISSISVTDEFGGSWNHTTYQSGDYTVLRIGDADRYVYGTQTYNITYTQRDVTRFFANTNSDEFYWDTNGTAWAVPISALSVKLEIDDSLIGALSGDTACYRGQYQLSDTCTLTQAGNIFTVSATNLTVGDNITIAVGFEKGTFGEYQQSLMEKLVIYWQWLQLATIPMAIILLVVAIIRFINLSNRKKELGTIVPEYIPPSNASVKVSADIITSTKGLTAQLIDLAVRHFIAIYETKPKSIFRQAEYTFKILRPIDPALRPEEQEILKDIFTTVDVGNEVSSKDLSKSVSVATRLQDNTGKTRKLIEDTYGLKVKDKTTSSKLYKLGHITLALGILSLSVSLVTVALIMYIMGAVIRPLTDEGLALRRYLLGLKMYISVAEEERLKMLQSPEGAEKSGVNANDPGQMVKLYERVLPYAILFGQEKEWNQRLGQLYESAHTTPDWYSGASLMAFNAAAFTSSMNSLTTSISSSGASSSSSGGSGGGGFSGGGGGGGGGGGW